LKCITLNNYKGFRKENNSNEFYINFILLNLEKYVITLE
jgi:hypothetical protein